jgi:hypothetical protein
MGLGVDRGVGTDVGTATGWGVVAAATALIAGGRSSSIGVITT